MNNRMRWAKWGPEGTRSIAPDSYWKQPLKWARDAKAAGVRPRVFCGSMCDILEHRPELAEFRDKLWGLIYETFHALDWLLLTKRIEHSILIPLAVLERSWLGVSCENQATADERIPLLLQAPAAVRFVSVEPMLGPVDLGLNRWIRLPRAVCSELPWEINSHARVAEPGIYRAEANRHNALSVRTPSGDLLGIKPAEFERLPALAWVICGGESGPGARPMDPAWARSLRDQCVAAGVPFFFKQWGEWGDAEAWKRHCEDHRNNYDWPAGAHRDGMWRAGKRAAGRLLDGREWNEFPEVRSG
jgi:protein gp37